MKYIWQREKEIADLLQELTKQMPKGYELTGIAITNKKTVETVFVDSLVLAGDNDNHVYNVDALNAIKQDVDLSLNSQFSWFKQSWVSDFIT